MRQKKNSFGDVLIGTINEVIRDVFDDETAGVILKHLEDLDSQNAEKNVEIFSDALSDVLGVGSVIIEDLILENLYLKYGLELKQKKNYGFTNHVMNLMISISEESK
jgi:hypothetical protein